MVSEQQRLSQITMFFGTIGVLQDCQAELTDGGLIVTLRHERPSQATVSALPAGIQLKQIAEFGDGVVVIAFVAVGVTKVVANHGFLRRKSFGFAVFRNRAIEASQVVQ